LTGIPFKSDWLNGLTQKSITNIQLSSTLLNDDGLKVITLNLPNLETLNISYTKISNIGIQYIGNNCNYMKYLNVSNTAISELSDLVHCTHLKILNIVNTSLLLKSTISGFRYLMPQVIIGMYTYIDEKWMESHSLNYM
jgi:hypothetical protein